MTNIKYDDNSKPDFDWTTISVLIIDDSMFFRNLVAGVLHAAGIKDIHHASDAATALRLLQSTTVDVALVDYLMMPLDGIEFTNMVRNAPDSPNREMPIIMITGDATQATLDHSLQNGAHDFVVKPISAKTILSRIHRVLSHPLPFVKRAGYYGPDHAAYWDSASPI